MIPRYSRAAMTAIWEPENRFRIWLDIELYALEKQAELGIAPKAAVAALKKAAKNHLAEITDPKAIDKIERETRHDVIAFLTNLAKYVRKQPPQSLAVLKDIHYTCVRAVLSAPMVPSMT